MTEAETVVKVYVPEGEGADGDATFERIRAVAEKFGPRVRVEREHAHSAQSVSLSVNGRAVPPSEAGSAEVPDWLVEAAILRESGPKGFLFLCVANSARSQMGEGVARLLAPADVRVQSAGSHPTSVRPEAATVLTELGVDLSLHASKNVADIDPTTVDTVITLCAEEECPVFLGKALRLHWGLPDPAAVEGDEETRLNAFRTVRDELKRRLSVVFS